MIAHATASPLALGLSMIAITLLIGASVAGLFVRFLHTLSTLLALAAVAALAPVWVGWQDGSPQIRGFATVVSALLPGIALTVGLLQPVGRLRATRSAGFFLGTGIVLGILSVAFRDPFRDLRCWNDCTAVTAFMPWPGGAIVAEEGLVVMTVAAAAIAIALQSRRLRHAESASRIWILLVGVPAAVLSVSLALQFTWSFAAERERASDPAFAVLTGSTWVGLILLGLGGGGVAVLSIYRRRVSTQLIAQLGRADRPDGLRAACAALLGDPGVSVAYWVPRAGCLVDATGEILEQPAGPATIEVRRAGELLAVVSTTRDIGDSDDLLSRIGSSAAMGIENERLQAELEFRLAQVIASRRRIVDSTLEARRALERDLHDGVQGGVVALLYGLAAAGDAGGPRIADFMAQASVIAERLRAIAHGIHPSMVDEMGLANALQALSDSRPVRIVTDEAVAGTPGNVSAIAYEVASRCADEWAGPEDLLVEVEGGSKITMTFVGNAPSLARETEDRVAALGGSVARSHAGLEVVIPCG